MKFSFILPAWKGRYLREAILSILNQSYSDFELIVVDDCSQDPLEKIVESFKDPRIEYHRNEHNMEVGIWLRSGTPAWNTLKAVM